MMIEKKRMRRLRRCGWGVAGAGGAVLIWALGYGLAGGTVRGLFWPPAVYSAGAPLVLAACGMWGIPRTGEMAEPVRKLRKACLQDACIGASLVILAAAFPMGEQRGFAGWSCGTGLDRRHPAGAPERRTGIGGIENAPGPILRSGGIAVRDVRWRWGRSPGGRKSSAAARTGVGSPPGCGSTPRPGR